MRVMVIPAILLLLSALSALSATPNPPTKAPPKAVANWLKKIVNHNGLNGLTEAFRSLRHW